jgi:hypothetical protein
VDVDKALILSKEILRLESPDERMLEVHRCTLKDLALDERTKLEGAEDRVALKPPADQDVVSRTLRNHWLFPSMVSLVHVGDASSLAYRKKALSSHEPGTIQFFYERRLIRVLKGLSVLISTMLIIGPILALNFTSSPNARLGIAIAFILLFAIGLSLSTGVSRDTIFGATATYSAVLVVYVSGNLGNAGGLDSASGSPGNGTALL